MKKLLLALSILALQSCTFLYYADNDRRFMVLDAHPSGETIAVTGEIDAIGSIDVSRDKGSNEDLITNVVDKATGL